MTDNINCIDVQIDLDEKIQIILRQTDYNEEIAKEKLLENNCDHLLVIKKYFGIAEKKEPTIDRKNLNQEIYKQIRFKLDKTMRDYNQRKELENT
uniref:Uncharacterized protein n=1 Tax=viral metagenome TaxID=1070528 RepID=A0A6C0DII1_9ZZZZ